MSHCDITREDAGDARRFGVDDVLPGWRATLAVRSSSTGAGTRGQPGGALVLSIRRAGPAALRLITPETSPAGLSDDLRLDLGLAMLTDMADALSLPAPSPAAGGERAIHDPFLGAAATALRDALLGGAPALHAEAVAHAMSSYLLLHGDRFLGESAPASGQVVALSAPQVTRVRTYMLEHLGDDVTLDELARVAHTSKYHFTRAFRTATGSTPRRYLTGLRMDEAVELLRTTSLPVGEVGRRVGYRTSSGFGGAFRRHHGQTPGDVRARRS